MTSRTQVAYSTFAPPRQSRTHVRMYMCTYTPVYANACARARYTHDGIVDDALQLVARLLARHDVGVAHVRAELLHLRQL